jgi:hypothetical protein
MNTPEVTHESIVDKRRTLRLRRSSLLKLDMEGLDKPSIKIAETLDEYQQAFRLVHNEYSSVGYIPPCPQHPYHYSHYSLLPETCVFLFKTNLTVVATLTEIIDTAQNGLPMDELYRKELDALRNQGRVVVELSAFVTSRTQRMRNIMVYMCNAMFNYSKINKIDDICIMVNPKHVQFYTQMFLFEPYGPERFYEKVQAPAVPLRVDMREIENRLRGAYSQYEFTEDLHLFFCRTNTTLEMLQSGSVSTSKRSTPREVLDFFGLEPSLPM